MRRSPGTGLLAHAVNNHQNSPLRVSCLTVGFFALLLAALSPDIDHPGTTNNLEVAMQSLKALTCASLAPRGVDFVACRSLS